MKENAEARADRIAAARYAEQYAAHERAVAGRIAACEFKRTGSGGVTLCVHLDGSSEIIRWVDAGEAFEAGRLLFDKPCSRKCQMTHSVTVYAEGQWQSISSRQPEPTREELFAAAYPRDHEALSVQLLPAPAYLNPALRVPVPAPNVPPSSTLAAQESYDRVVLPKPTPEAAQGHTADREAATV